MHYRFYGSTLGIRSVNRFRIESPSKPWPQAVHKNLGTPFVRKMANKNSMFSLVVGPRFHEQSPRCFSWFFPFQQTCVFSLGVLGVLGCDPFHEFVLSIPSMCVKERKRETRTKRKIQCSNTRWFGLRGEDPARFQKWLQKISGSQRFLPLEGGPWFHSRIYHSLSATPTGYERIFVRYKEFPEEKRLSWIILSFLFHPLW